MMRGGNNDISGREERTLEFQNLILKYANNELTLTK